MRFAIGVTGHRSTHSSFPSDSAKLIEGLNSILVHIEEISREEGATDLPRLTTLLADGADQVAAQAALDREWEVSVPLPYGRALNRALSGMPHSAEELDAVLNGSAGAGEATRRLLQPIIDLEEKVRLFEITERDEAITDLLRRSIEEPTNAAVSNSLLFETAQRYAISGRIIVEQSDLLIAIWDGQSHANIGGTGDTVRTALREAIPVLRIDPAEPQNWCILTGSEMLGAGFRCEPEGNREKHLRQIIRHSLAGGAEDPFAALESEKWHPRSSVWHHGYRRIETMFGKKRLAEKFASIRHTYETPEAIGSGSAAPMMDSVNRLARNGGDFAERVRVAILERLAWTDGISARLSDRHRSGMIMNFALGSIAIIAGLFYLPLVPPEYKWPFAAIELVVLLLIVLNTSSARKKDLHGRWFATRRAAEYLRHRPLMLLAGVARPAGQWPHEAAVDWPERYVRQSAREVGLPREQIDGSWLQHVLDALKDKHVIPQRDYHLSKAARLKHAHHTLDVVSEWLFFAAIIAVSSYLILAGAQYLGVLESLNLTKIGKWLTLAGVAFPTIGGAIAGIRYFGDYERFGDISEVTARRLDEVVSRIEVLQQAPVANLQYPDVAELLRSTDQIVMSELESWQDVFSGKRISVPV